MPQLTEELRAAFAGHYAIEREISRSAMAAVFLASDVRHDRPVAIKVLDREFAGETGVERFRREIQVVARFQHPHILPLFESGEAAGALFYVMPYVEGETLRGRISREGVLAVDEAVRIASEICDALSYAHAQGIVHRDIKPENILLNGPHALVLDFGIARLLQRTGTGSVTASGIVVGTPAYMSPEQASGEFELDGRSDIYSLACVLYEMLSGSPPHHSRSPQMMLAARLQTPARPLRELNRPIPPVLDAAVQRALALDPRDRYTSANEFAAALQLGLAPVTPYPTVREQTRRVRGRVIAMLVAIAVLLAIGVYQVVRNRAPSPPLDAKAVVILPMLHQLSTDAFPLDGDNCARLLYDAFSRWTGIHLVNDMLVREMREREGGSVKDVESAVRIGRQLGARYVAWGNVIGSPGEVNVRVALYDVKDKRAAPAAQVVISRGDDLPQRFATLADSLVRGVVSGASAVGGAEGSRDFDAVQLYASAHAALDRWNLAAAESLFRAATRADTGFAQAYYQLAQVMSWQSAAPREDWRAAAARAAALGARLGERQRTLAQGLLALAERRYQDACSAYSSLVAKDSLEFAAWFGLGECQSQDPVVLADAKSRSGWRFRTSQHAAIEAYVHALSLVPSFQNAFAGRAYSRVGQLLYTEGSSLRRGVVVAGDSQFFRARAEVSGDTLAFIPYPEQWVYDNRPETYPPTFLDAMNRNRRRLRDLASQWTRSNPQSPLAYEALATALEMNGEFEAPAGRGGAIGALEAVDRARALALTPDLRARLGAQRVRLLLKLERYAESERAADSLLLMDDAQSPETAHTLGSVAALFGRVAEAAAHTRIAAREITPFGRTRTLQLPLPFYESADLFTLYASLGAPVDSARRELARAMQILSATRGRDMSLHLRDDLLSWGVMLSYPDAGLSPLHADMQGTELLIRTESAHARGDTATVRRGLTEFDASGANEFPGDFGYDMKYVDVWLHLALADTAKAVHDLDEVLDAVPASGRQLITFLPASAMFPRILAVRAELAGAAGDRATAQRRAAAVAAMYLHADSVLQPTIARMRALQRQ